MIRKLTGKVWLLKKERLWQSGFLQFLGLYQIVSHYIEKQIKKMDCHIKSSIVILNYCVICNNVAKEHFY